MLFYDSGVRVKIKLATKLNVSRSLILLVTMIVFAYLCITSLEKMYLNEAIADADTLSETIIRSVNYHMLEDDLDRAYHMIEEISEHEGIETIRFFNHDGLINFSTEKNEVGTFLDANAEDCNWCHYQTPVVMEDPDAIHTRTFTNSAGHKVLGVTKDILNEPSCSTAQCHAHPEEDVILGVLDIHISLEKMEAQVLSARNGVIAFTIAMIFTLAICLNLLINRLINRPVVELLEHTRAVARGDLGSRVERVRNDEFGELAEAFNDMTYNLEVAHDELTDWGNTLEHKVEERTKEIKQMQSKLVQSAKLASLGELVAGIAHEINNPLTGILTFSSMAANDPRLHPDLKQDLEMIVGETERCARIVQNLLKASHETVLEKRYDCVNRVMDHTLTLISKQPCLAAVNIIRNYEKDLPACEIDPEQIEQVFMNIVLNAGQAMPDGGILWITSSRQGDSVVIEILDTGAGISDEVIENIFDPFFTTKGRKKGTGLGLSISYGIVKNHGGSIEVHSQIGEGTSFVIQLPLSLEGEQGN